MTVQAGIETVLDLEVLVGEIDAPPCESVGHDTERVHTDGPATHYVRVFCSHISMVKPYCQGFIDFLNRDGIVLFPDCGESIHASECAIILAPINSSTR